MSILTKALNYISINPARLDIIILALMFMSGLSILFFPIEYLLLFIASIALIIFISLKPVYLYYLVLVFAPMVTFIDFSIVTWYECLVFLCILGVLINIIVFNEKVDMKTQLDKWIIILVIIFIYAGFVSVGYVDGIKTMARFLDGVAIYYLSIYFIRSKKVSIITILQLILCIGLFEALTGIFQSITGIGAKYSSSRGYLGYLGIGSKNVWHGTGTLIHFNILCPLLVSIALAFLPFLVYHVKNKKLGILFLIILLLGVMTTYSRGGLLGLFLGLTYFLMLIQKNKFKSFKVLITMVLIVAPFVIHFIHSNYAQTLYFAQRVNIWQFYLGHLLNNPFILLFGTGLSGFRHFFGNFIPYNLLASGATANEGMSIMSNSHNHYLSTLFDIGIVGFIVYFSFFVKLFRDSYKYIRQSKKFNNIIFFAFHMYIFTFFTTNIFDEPYSYAPMRILVFFLIAVVYSNSCNGVNELSEAPDRKTITAR